MTFDIEKELARAMSAEVEALPEPRIDLARIRRRARSRRFGMPVVVVVAGATAMAPLAAVSQLGSVGSHPVRDLIGPVNTATASPHPAPAATTPPPLAGARGEQADAASVPTAAASAACWTAPRALTTGDRAGVVRQVRATVAAREHALNQRLAGLATVKVPLTDDVLDRLVPATGTLVEHTGCGPHGHVSKDAEQHVVVAAEAAVNALAGLLEKTLGTLGVRGVPVVVTITSSGDGRTTVRIAVHGGTAIRGTITAALCSGTGEVVETDTRRLLVGDRSVADVLEATDPLLSDQPSSPPQQPAHPATSPAPLLPNLADLSNLTGAG
jgi:hypothetical protein